MPFSIKANGSMPAVDVGTPLRRAPHAVPGMFGTKVRQPQGRHLPETAARHVYALSSVVLLMVAGLALVAWAQDDPARGIALIGGCSVCRAGPAADEIAARADRCAASIPPSVLRGLASAARPTIFAATPANPAQGQESR